MKFLIDAQLSPSLARWLSAEGVDALHVEQAGLRDADDRAIRDFAIRAGFVLITKDRDFVPTDQAHHTALQVVWIRTGNMANRILLARIAAAWPAILAHLESGARIVELR